MVMKRILLFVVIALCLDLVTGCRQGSMASREVDFIAEIKDVTLIQPVPTSIAEGKRPWRARLIVKELVSGPAPFMVGDTVEFEIPETHELVAMDYIATYPYQFRVELDGQNNLHNLRLLKDKKS